MYFRPYTYKTDVLLLSQRTTSTGIKSSFSSYHSVANVPGEQKKKRGLLHEELKKLTKITPHLACYGTGKKA